MAAAKGIRAAACLLVGLAVAGCAPSGDRDPDDFAANFREYSWEETLSIAEGQSVFWYMWGGSEAINRYVTEYVAGRLQSEFGITLELVPLADTADAVNKIISDNQAHNEDGSIDLVWINGENFRTLQTAELLFGPYSDLLPNLTYVDPDSDALRYDYGYPVDGYESPYGAAQFVIIYDSARVADPPRSLSALLNWTRQNPGKFTYPLLPDFVGSAFVRHAFYLHATNPDAILQPFDEGRYEQIASRTWDTLNDIEPFLWRGGKTYPESQAKLEQLFGNGEVWFDLSYNPAKGGVLVESGQYPPTTRSYVFDEGTLSNYHYVAIPYNAQHKAGAMVLANLLLDPRAQLEKNKSEVWGDPTVLSLDRMPAEVAGEFRTLDTHPSAASTTELQRAGLAEPQSPWVEAIERDWVTRVLMQ